MMNRGFYRETHTAPVSRDAGTAWPRPEWLLAAFVVVFVSGTAGRAVSKPLWHDELFTFYLATRTTAVGLWNALANAADLNPPLYHLAVRASSALLGAGSLATRLPALLGFLAASLALYVFMRRRVDTRFALVGALVPSLTGVYMYAYEGRPYGLVLGFSAVALAAWQHRGESMSRPLAPLLCALMLAAATLTHYYALLTVLPLAAGELTRIAVHRRIDVWMWVALTFAITPLVLLRPLIEAARQFAPTFWSRPALSGVTDFYRQLLDPLSLIVLAAAGLITVAALWHRARTTAGSPARDRQAVPPPGLPADEIVIALALLSLPVVGSLVAVFVTGAFHERYVLQGVLGFAILMAWWSARLVRSNRDATILLAVLFLAFSARQAGGALGLVRSAPDPLAEHRGALARFGGESPVVVSHALVFLPLVHYTNGRSEVRLTYLTRPPDVVQQLGSDTGGRALSRLAELVPLPIEDYDRFVSMHSHFYVYGPQSWLIRKLLSDGAGVRLIDDRTEASLYEVRLSTGTDTSRQRR